MKKLFSILASACLLIVSCSKEPSEPSAKIGAVTGEASHISCRNAKISGKANLPSTTSTDLSFGVLYSTSSGVLIGTATQIRATKPDADYNFTIDTEVLEPETTYYYRSYITQSGEVTYGETKSFKTIAVSSMIRTEDATDINPKDAVLNADLDLTDCNHTSIEYGFDITLEGGSMRKVRSYNYADNKFSCKDELLTRDKQYYFVAYVTLDGRTYRGEAKSFTTASVQASVTAEASNVSYSTATISGKLTVTSEGSFAKSAILYYSTTANTLDALKSSGTKQTISLESDGTYSVIAKGLASNAKNYYCVIAKVDDKEFATSVNNFTTKSLPEGAVDLGLSILWHKQNIGASSPEQYGRYFAWGDVTGQTWDGSKWSGGGFSTYPTYELDANNNLKPEYDAAHVNLGGSWRMPTKAEQQELINNCTRTWTSNYNGTGVAGIIFISTKPGYEGNSIFLPAAGYGWNSDLFYAGSGGYWSSTFSSGDEAWCLVFFSGNVYTSNDYRLDGRPVRPVSE